MRPSSCCKGLQINRPIGIETAARSSPTAVSVYTKIHSKTIPIWVLAFLVPASSFAGVCPRLRSVTDLAEGVLIRTRTVD
jgi:hypothetical protein